MLTKATAMPGYRMAEGYIALGQAYVNLKRYPEAVTALEKATLSALVGLVWASLAAEGWVWEMRRRLSPARAVKRRP